MLKRFLRYYRPHRRLFAMDMLASLLVAMIGILYPVVTRTMLNDLIPERQYTMIVVCGVGLLLLYLLRMLLSYFIQYQGHMMGVRMQAQMRRDMFEHLEKLPFSFFDNHETGKIMSRMTNDLMDISELAHHGPENIIISSVSVLLSFFYLYSIYPPLTLIIFGCVPFLLVMATVLRKRMRAAFTRSRQSIAQINATLEGSISGIRVTKAFNNSECEMEKFEQGNHSFVDARKDAYSAMGMFHSGTSFITDVFHVVVLIAGGLFMYAEQIEFADYSTFIVSVSVFLSPVMTLINFMEQFQNGVTGFERFLEIMDTEPERDAPDAVDAGVLEGHITLEDVSYGYEDGKDVRSLTRASVRRNIGIVQQDVYLFNASMRDNILYGDPQATEEQVIEAAKRANIHDYIMSLEHGYDTQVGERGVRLSGGQKQRLSIARVFLKNPAILILDEATSALDNATEMLIQEALDELCRGRTTLVVAHRLSTVKNADEIAVIDNGEMIEQGDHEALLQRDGVYAKLYRQQFRDQSN